MSLRPRAADAAQTQANIASQQLWTGWLQTLGGFLTLVAAIGAAIYARSASKHTEFGNEFAKRAERPFLIVPFHPSIHVIKRQASDDDGKYVQVEFGLSVRNAGRSAAIVDQIDVRVRPSPGPLRWIAGYSFRVFKIIDPGASEIIPTQRTDSSIRIEDFTTYLAEKVSHSSVFEIGIRYRDAAGIIRWSYSAYSKGGSVRGQYFMASPNPKLWRDYEGLDPI